MRTSSSSCFLMVLLCFMISSFVFEGVSARIKGDEITMKLSSTITIQEVAEQLQGRLGEPRCGKIDPNSCCSPGRCCSIYGYCGGGPLYCGNGNCQSQCPCNANWIETVTESGAEPESKFEPEPEAEIDMETDIRNSTIMTFLRAERSDSRCGQYFPGSCCNPGRCCSRSGWCGSGKSYCGRGGPCQSNQCYCDKGLQHISDTDNTNTTSSY